ncbi:hypothetical protein K461DRAFT_321449 [Myriangium duriaei CBS 260.36]|uniref:EamA domain-containing protein n=1 Tax=Myriangium duriaei CBS 260.36 TaxID=1168546 RepID=A0A9P4IYY6_9PEZI|nr:hypothetical protein K461DRAFT_321449 [Myriangium duriaei CBS 260.36]
MPEARTWLLFAIASGACAAINGTFAKLTTTSLTGSIANFLATLLHVPDSWTHIFEIVVRAGFFGLNLLFDALMWGLFTRALTLAKSTVHVSVLNTGTNFMVAAGAGWAVFGERLPPMWFLGASLLIAGCLLIGSREGGAAAIKGGAHGGETEEQVELLARSRQSGESERRSSYGSSTRHRSPYLDEGEEF